LASNSLTLKSAPFEELGKKGHVGLEFLDLQRVRVLRELDGDSQSQLVFLAFLRIPVLHELSPNTETRTMLALQGTNLGEPQCGLVPNLGIDSDFNFVRIQ